MNIYVSLALIVTLPDYGKSSIPLKPIPSRFHFFDIDLLRLSAEDQKGNVMVSPASLKATLGMILEGAVGETAEEIRRALRLTPGKDEFREQLNYYLNVLQSNSSLAMVEMANGVFYSNNLKIKKEYKLMIKNAYSAELFSLDLKNPKVSADTINNWVNNKTRGLIPQLIEQVQVTPASSLIISNALYFKSHWQTAFNPALTKPRCFFDGGKCKMVPMMELHASLNYTYVDDLRAHAVELPYQDDRYAMVILVPQDRDGGLTIIRDLPFMSLAQVVESMEPTDVDLSMPRFSVEYSEDLVPVLKNMKINALFSEKVNLSGIFESTQSQINNIFHKTRLDVNEIGTKAAAVTSAMVVPLMESGVDLMVDKPFLFFIRDQVTGGVLFEGKVEEPESLAAAAGVGDRYFREYGVRRSFEDLRNIFSRYGHLPKHPSTIIKFDTNY